MSDAPQGPGWWQASDGKWYPPQPSAPTAPPPPPPGAPTAPPPPQAYPPPMPGAYPMAPPPKQGMSGCLKAFLITLVIVLVGGIALVVVFFAWLGDEVNDFIERQEEAQDDAQLVDCREEGGFMIAVVELTNDSRGESDYTVTVSFENARGDQLTTGVGFASGLDPGQRRTLEISSFREAAGGFSCEVESVFRISSEFAD